MKRALRIEMGLPVPPLSMPVSTNGDHDANNIKDCNINKHEAGQKIVITVHNQVPDLTFPPIILFATYLSAATELNITAAELTKYTTRQYAIGAIPVLYLQHGRLQV